MHKEQLKIQIEILENRKGPKYRLLEDGRQREANMKKEHSQSQSQIMPFKNRRDNNCKHTLNKKKKKTYLWN